MKKEAVISEELALNETKKFLAKFEKKELSNLTDEEIVNNYDFIIENLMSGNLTFTEDFQPSYKLIKPILSDKDEVIYDILKLETRIKPSVMASIADTTGANKQGSYVNALTARVAGFASTAYLDKLSVKDYNFISSIAPLFFNGGY